MKPAELLYKPFGDRAVLIQWAEDINTDTLEDVLFCKEVVIDFRHEEILEVINTYNSLLIFYCTTIENFYTEVLELKECFLQAKLNRAKKNMKKRLWDIPVCYDKKLAPDLDDYCDQKSISKEHFVALHADKIYTMYFIGFLPGFMYFGGLDSALFIPRKAQPSLVMPKGTVAIGGQQTGIYPQNSPGGWYGIGCSPLSFFTVNADPPCFVSPGDKVKFKSIDLNEYNAISSLVDAGIYTPNASVYGG